MRISLSLSLFSVYVVPRSHRFQAAVYGHVFKHLHEDACPRSQEQGGELFLLAVASRSKLTRQVIAAMNEISRIQSYTFAVDYEKVRRAVHLLWRWSAQL